MRFFIGFFLAGFVAACLPQSNVSSRYDKDKSTLISEESQAASGIDINLDGEIYRASGRSRKVSSLDLEDPRFGISYLTPSLEEYLNSETIKLAFERPLDADYVEILRCKDDVIVDTGIVLIDFKDWALNNISDDEKTSLYNTSDVFRVASSQAGCTYLNAGTVEEVVPDAWAESDSYRYLAVACVAPNRLTDTELTSRRNCSKRFAISPIIHYRNARKEEEKEAIQGLEIIRSSLDTVAATIGEQAFSLIEAMDDCEQREYNRSVDTETKNSVLQLVGAAGELVIEILDFTQARGAAIKGGKSATKVAASMAKGMSKSVTKSGVKGAAEGAAEEAAERAAKSLDAKTSSAGRKASSQTEETPGFTQTTIDVTQLGQAMEGMTFTMILTNLFASAADMPRTCETALSKRETLEITMNQVLILAEEYSYLSLNLEQIRKGLSNQAGLETEGVDTSSLGGSNSTESSSNSSSGGLYDD